MALALLIHLTNIYVMYLVIKVDDNCTQKELMIIIWAVMVRSGSR